MFKRSVMSVFIGLILASAPAWASTPLEESTAALNSLRSLHIGMEEGKVKTAFDRLYIALEEVKVTDQNTEYHVDSDSNEFSIHRSLFTKSTVFGENYESNLNKVALELGEYIAILKGNTVSLMSDSQKEEIVKNLIRIIPQYLDVPDILADQVLVAQELNERLAKYNAESAKVDGQVAENTRLLDQNGKYYRNGFIFLAISLGVLGISEVAGDLFNFKAGMAVSIPFYFSIAQFAYGAATDLLLFVPTNKELNKFKQLQNELKIKIKIYSKLLNRTNSLCLKSVGASTPRK